MKNKLRVGIVGLGHIAETTYLNAIANSRFTTFVSACDTDKSRFSLLDQEVSTYSDFREMINKEELDFVIDLTPHNVHFEVLKAAAEAGICVLKEKPLARSLDEAIAMDTLSKKAGISVMVALQRRYSEMYGRFRNFVGEVKNPFLAELKYTIFVEKPDSGWRGKRESAGGGCILDMGYHLIDLMIWYLGLPDRVCVKMSSKAVGRNYDAEDTAAILFEYHKGPYGTMTISRSYSPQTESIRLTGSNGFCELQKEFIRICDTKGKEQKRVEKQFNKSDLATKEIDYFARTLRGEVKPMSSIAENMHHMAFVEACYESVKKGGFAEPKMLLSEAGVPVDNARS